MKRFNLIVNVLLFILAVVATIAAGWLFFSYLDFDCGSMAHPPGTGSFYFWSCSSVLSELKFLAEISGILALIFWVASIWHLRWRKKKYSKLKAL